MTHETNTDTIICDTAITTLNDAKVAPIPVKVMHRWTPEPGIWAKVDKVPWEHEQVLWEACNANEVTTLELQNGLKLQGVRTRFNPTMGTSVSASFRINGSVTTLKLTTELVLIQFDIVNFPNFRGPQDLRVTEVQEEEVTYRTLGSVQIQVGSWYLELTAEPDLADNDYAVTHTGRIARHDGAVFSIEEGMSIHTTLMRFLSFARGGRCGSTCLRGKSRKDGWVWEQWGNPRVSPVNSQPTWFDLRHGELLTQVFPGFLHFWEQSTNQQTMLVALDWYCETLIASSTYTRIVLIQIVLERLASMLGESHGRLSERVRKALKRIQAASCIEVPLECKALASFVPKKDDPDGPGKLVEIRNDLIHAGMQHGILLGEVYFEASQLGLWYAELQFLYLFDHRGQYSNRITRKAHGDLGIVPWASVLA